MNSELLIRIKADVGQTNARLDDLKSRLAGVDTSARRTAEAAERLSDKMRQMGHAGVAFVALSQLAQGLSGSLARLAQSADAFNVVTAKMRMAAGAAADFGAIQARVFAIAQAAGARFEDIGEAYAKVAKGAQSLGLTQDRVLGVTQAIADAMRLMGGSSAGVAAALNQFGQALSSGQLRSEELNSVLEQFPALAEAIAQGMGRTAGELRKLAEAGALTVEEIVLALEKSAPRLAEQAKDMPLTFSAGMAVLNNAFDRYAATLDRAMGASSAFNTVVRALAENIDKAAVVAAVMASAVVGKLVGALAQATMRHIEAAAAARAHAIAEAQAALDAANAARVRAAADAAAAAAAMRRAEAALAEATAERALLAQMAVYGPARARVEAQIAQAHLARKTAAEAAAAAEARLTAASAAAQAAAGQLAAAGRAASLLRGALNLLGGRIGAITTLLFAGVSAWTLWGNAAQEAADKAERRMKSLKDRLAEVNQQIGEMEADRARLDALERELSQLRARQADLAKGLPAGQSGMPMLPNKPTQEQRKALTEWARLQNEIAAKQREYEAAVEAFAKIGVAPRVREYLEKGRTKAEEVAREIERIDQEYKRALALLDKRDPNYKTLAAELARSRDNQIAEARRRLGSERDRGNSPLAALIDDTAAGRRAAFERLSQEALKIKDAATREEVLTALIERYYRPEIEAAERLAEAEREARAHMIEAHNEVVRERGEYLEALRDALAQAQGKNVAVAQQLRLSPAQRQMQRELDEVEAIAQRLKGLRAYFGDAANSPNLAPLFGAAEDMLKGARRSIEEAGVIEQAIERVEGALGRYRNRLALSQADLEHGFIDQSKAQRLATEAAREALPVLQDNITLLSVYAERGMPRAVEALQRYIEALTDLKGKAADKTAFDGLAQGLKDVAGAWRDRFGEAREAVKRAFEGMTDAITEFVMTGKLKVSDLANSIIRDLIRIHIQEGITKPLAGFLGDAIRGMFTKNALGGVYASADLHRHVNRVVNQPTLFTFAAGGIPRLGLMGEAGPEAILPLRRGPGGRLGVEAHGAGHVVVNVSVDASGSRVEGDAGAARQLGDMIAGAVRGILVAEKRPGGLLAGT